MVMCGRSDLNNIKSEKLHNTHPFRHKLFTDCRMFVTYDILPTLHLIRVRSWSEHRVGQEVGDVFLTENFLAPLLWIHLYATLFYNDIGCMKVRNEFFENLLSNRYGHSYEEGILWMDFIKSINSCIPMTLCKLLTLIVMMINDYFKILRQHFGHQLIKGTIGDQDNSSHRFFDKIKFNTMSVS